MTWHFPALFCAAGITLGTGGILGVAQAVRAAPVVVEALPPYVEEGSTYNGSVVVAQTSMIMYTSMMPGITGTPD